MNTYSKQTCIFSPAEILESPHKVVKNLHCPVFNRNATTTVHSLTTGGQ